MSAAASVFHLGDNARQQHARRKPGAVDPDLLVIEHNFKMPARRSATAGKYDAKFTQLKPGSAIVCEPGEVGPVATALSNAIRSGKLPALAGCKVRSFQKLADGRGRVVAVPIKKLAEAICAQEGKSNG